MTSELSGVISDTWAVRLGEIVKCSPGAGGGILGVQVGVLKHRPHVPTGRHGQQLKLYSSCPSSFPFIHLLQKTPKEYANQLS